MAQDEKAPQGLIQRHGGLLVALAALLVIYPLLTGDPPVGKDHPVHLYKAWHFWEVMLASGRVSGWSDHWFLGYPAGDLYPPGTDLWLAVVHAGSLARLSWPATYALGFAAAYAFCAWAVWCFGRRLLGPVPALLAALLWIADPGAPEQGGWAYVVAAGVWAQALAQAFLLLFLADAWSLLHKARPLITVRAALTLGAATLCHPVTLPLVGVTLPILVVAHALSTGSRRIIPVARLAGVVVLGTCLAGFWLFPMVTHWSWTTGTGYGSTADLLADELARLHNPWLPWLSLGGLALLGVILGPRSRRGAALFLAASGSLLGLSASMDLPGLLGLDEILPMLSRIQYRRFAMCAKSCLLPLAGLGIVSAVQLVRADVEAIAAQAQPSRGAVGWVGRGAMALVLVLGTAWWGAQFLSLPDRCAELRTARRSVWWNGAMAAAAFTAERAAADPRFFRVCWHARAADHRFVATSIVSGLPLYKTGFTPAKLYNNIPRGGSPEALAALSVRYLIQEQSQSSDGWSLVHQAGRFHVYELDSWRPERWRLQGPGAVEVLQQEPERVRLGLTGTGPDSTLVLMVGVYPRWRATLDGAPLNITPTRAFANVDAADVISVPARDGLLELRYARLPVDWIGRGASLLALLGALLLAVLGWRRGSRAGKD